MLGNAVPSLLAEVMAREIRKQFLNSPVQGPYKLMPKRRTPIPAAEKVAVVPDQYLHLIGDHADHPGTGKSVKAKLRNTALPSKRLLPAE